MDRNKYYGGDSASLSPLDEVRTCSRNTVFVLVLLLCVLLGLVCACMCATASTDSQVSLFLDHNFLVDG